MIVGIGTDAVDIDRFRAVIARTPRLVMRVFTDSERADMEGRADPAPGLAARFAAKEAVMKVLGVGLGGAKFSDIGVHRAPSGQPSLVLHGRAQQLATEQGVSHWHLSLSHSESTAQAFVVAESVT